MPIRISSRFDSGAIEVIDAERADDIRLRLRADSAADFAQWFHFRVNGVKGVACRYTFENAATSAYPEGWRGYHVAASYDGVKWFRVSTTFYDGQTMVLTHTPDADTVFYAYFEPYGEARHHAFLGEVAQSGLAEVEDIGLSCEGRPITVVKIGREVARTEAVSRVGGDATSAGSGSGGGNGNGDSAAAVVKPRVWIIARQHPGETMAEWFVEGMIRRLTGMGDWAGDPIGARLREIAVIRLVPNMNPDGSALGNLRTNAAGANLNREWMTPDAKRSPEVLAVRNAVAQTGLDMFFDIHGDEVLPYNFVAGSEMLPDFTPEQLATQSAFVSRFKAISPDFQDVEGYPVGLYREDALTLASKYMAHEYGCLSLTLEMPFKDNANAPDANVGWNGARSAALGAAMCQAILQQIEAEAV